MGKKLSPHQKNTLTVLEPKLREAVKALDASEAEALTKRILALFLNDRDYHRVLQAKNWYYECLIECGRTEEAKEGLEVVLKRAKSGTRVYLEASSLLAVCYLRLHNIEAAKKLLRGVIKNINAIASDSRRRQFQKRLVERIEDEVVLSQLIGRSEGKMEPEAVLEEAVKLLQQKTEGEIYTLIGGLLPSSAGFLLQDVRNYAILMLPAPDQKLLNAAPEPIPKETMGKKTMGAMKRMAWRSFCDPKSEVYKTWNNPKGSVYLGGFLSASIVATLNDWKIGLPQLATGVVAVALRFGCLEFCETFKPDGLMIPRGEKD